MLFTYDTVSSNADCGEMKKISAYVLASTLLIAALVSGCKAQGQNANIPEGKVKNAYFAMMTCQGNEARGQYDEAEHYCKQGLQELNGMTHPLLEPLYSALADIYLRKGRYNEAESIQKKLIGITAQIDGKESANYADALAAYGSSMVRDAKFLEGKLYIDESLPILKNKSAEAKSLSWSLDWYQAALQRDAMIEVSQLKDSEALDTLKTLANYNGRPNVTDVELRLALAKIYAQVGEIYYRLDVPNLSKARSFYETALTLNKTASSQLPRVQENTKRYIKTQVVPQYDLVMAGHHLAGIYLKNGMKKEAYSLACSMRSWDEYYKAHPPIPQ